MRRNSGSRPRLTAGSRSPIEPGGCGQALAPFLQHFPFASPGEAGGEAGDIIVHFVAAVDTLEAELEPRPVSPSGRDRGSVSEGRRLAQAPLHKEAADGVAQLVPIDGLGQMFGKAGGLAGVDVVFHAVAT